MRTLCVIAVLAAASACVRSGFTSWLVEGPADASRDASHDAGEDSGPAPISGDLDHDGCVGCADFEIFLEQLGTTGSGLVADLDGNGAVTAADYAVLLAHWSQGCPQTPTWSLTLSLSGFDAHVGRNLTGALLDADDLVVRNFTHRVTAGTASIAVASGLDLTQQVLLHLYLDLDGDLRCGSPDLAWPQAVDPQGCAVVLDVTPAATSSRAACVGFAITGDVDGDGCVSRADRDYVNQQSLQPEPDLAADVNRDGAVNGADAVALDANLGIGCPMPDAGPGDVAIADAARRDAPAPDRYTGACGDQMCTDGETCTRCADCATLIPVCGNGLCDGAESSASCFGDCGPANWPDSSIALETEIKTLINGHRASGANCPTGAMPAVPALSMDSGLRAISRNECWDYSHHNYDPGIAGRCCGASIFELMVAAGYGEPLGAASAWGYGTAAEVVAGWMASDSLCPILMSSSYTVIGVGVADDVGPPWYIAAFH